jgi:hypothetical protein
MKPLGRQPTCLVCGIVLTGNPARASYCKACRELVHRTRRTGRRRSWGRRKEPGGQ